MNIEKPQLPRRVHRFLEQTVESGGRLPSLEAQQLLAEHAQRTNIDDALEIVAEIDRVRSVIRELKAAFARSELDGGAKAAPKHPLYVECEERLAKLHDELMMVI
ncbi:hypothetical protein SEA_TEMPO_12 [Microbacterium phage Tempo]|nr:hypothetical protein SEA_TEMPO_12 [Microbacterium phage Tempo]UOW92755.1 hypothetical protein SEA_ROBINROSE_13 [Microbacterium phage RobinRose]